MIRHLAQFVTGGVLSMAAPRRHYVSAGGDVRTDADVPGLDVPDPHSGAAGCASRRSVMRRVLGGVVVLAVSLVGSGPARAESATVQAPYEGPTSRHTLYGLPLG